MLAFPVGSLAVKAAIGRKSLYDLTVSATPRPRNRFNAGRREFSTLAISQISESAKISHARNSAYTLR